MWLAVTPRFQKFHNDLKLTSEQLEDGLTKARGIAGSLHRSYYPNSESTPPAFLVGSWGKQTQVRPPNDVDMMFEMPSDVFTRISQRVGNVQSALLQEVKNILSNTYTSTDMRGDGQVVQVKFNTIMVEVVPVFRLTNNNFYMPYTNNGGSWKTVSPIVEMKNIAILDDNCHGNVRAMCQMIKLWKREQNVALKSFQIELLVQEFMSFYEYRYYNYYYYDWFVRDFLNFLISKANQGIIIPGTNEYINLGEVWKPKAESAYATAVSACEWERADYDVTAGQEWQKIFGNRIPIKVL